MSLPVVVSLVWMAFVERLPRGVGGMRLVAVGTLLAYGSCPRAEAVAVRGAVSGGGGGWW
jgi:hypothetical protein